MKAARRIRAYLDARAETKTTETYVFSIRTEAGYVHGVQVKDLEALLASRARYRRRARAEHKAAQSLLADNAALLIENAALQEQLRRVKTAPAADPASPGVGVRKIYEARAYQLSRYPAQHDQQPGHAGQLFAAATALLLRQQDLYPFGESSWRGILRRDGRAGQLAHAGACIAALIDLLPPAPQAQPGTDYRERRARDHAAYPGEAGDLF